MRTITRVFLACFLSLLFLSTSYATWSIIVIDPRTHEIGIAGASCTYSVYGIGAIVPGKGAIVVQAMSNSAARTKGVDMILSDASPKDIMMAIRNPEFDPENQQYAVICSDQISTPLTYTGSHTDSSKGSITGKGISVQGNTLTGTGELKAVFEAALQAQKKGLPIQEVLMLALEAGARVGGDKRCGDRKAASAFLTVAKPTDTRQKPYINLIVLGNNENINAVTALRQKFDAWRMQQTK